MASVEMPKSINSVENCPRWKGQNFTGLLSMTSSLACSCKLATVITISMHN